MFNTKLTFMKHFTKFALLLVLGMGLAHTALAQIVGGGIKDAQGQPVIGASVTVDGTTLGTTSDVGGNFQLNVPDAKNAVLTVSFIGYATQSVPVNGRSQLDIVLAEDAQTLDDVVVIGYQTVKRKDLTGSVASVTGKDVSAMPVSNVAQDQRRSVGSGGFDRRTERCLVDRHLRCARCERRYPHYDQRGQRGPCERQL